MKKNNLDLKIDVSADMSPSRSGDIDDRDEEGLVKNSPIRMTSFDKKRVLEQILVEEHSDSTPRGSSENLKDNGRTFALAKKAQSS